MMKENQKRLCVAVCMLFSFVLWTVLICLVDVRPVGVNGSAVGFVTVNQAVHNFFGVNMTLYVVTDLLSLVLVLIMVGFGILGLCQWIRRKQLRAVDFDILALGGFYLVVAAVYALFEVVVVNYRPILIEGAMEASYPSSTTLLVMCVLPTAIIQVRSRIANPVLRRSLVVLLSAFLAFMVLCRLISGVHWFTDIIGGVLLSSFLVELYSFVCNTRKK